MLTIGLLLHVLAACRYDVAMPSWFPEFAYPELALLGLPLWYCYARWGKTRRITSWLRLAIAGLLLLALTGPSIRSAGEGIDVVVIVDRSVSMPAGSLQKQRQMIEAVEQSRNDGDRLGIVTFGIRSHIERPLSNVARLQEFMQVVEADGSDLTSAVSSALSLADSTRPTRLLLLTDGENNGRDIGAVVQQASDLKIPVDYRLFERLSVRDSSIEMIELPASVLVSEPFQFSVFVESDDYQDARIDVVRNDAPIARQSVSLQPGRNRFVFRDRINVDGLATYTATLTLSDDTFGQNNVANAVVLVKSEPRILVLNADGKTDNLVRALKAGGIAVDHEAAGSHPLTSDSLDRYQAVILENVRARSLGRVRMESLARYVDELGGGLMMTGGQNSFGVGGYYKSPLDPLLPVSMELRDEDRADRMALAIVLDRSGSMRVQVSATQSKMDLANLGTAESIRLLSDGDSVSVIAVDTQAEIVVPLTQVNDADRMSQRVAKIESAAGGIYVYNALLAAEKELGTARQSNKHILLFSDASDSEQPGDYRRLLQSFDEQKITVSVIGLGTERDPDARLLMDIGKRGNGTVMFTNDARELPRLFTEDTMNAAQSTFVTAPTSTGIGGQPLPTLRLLGNLNIESFPSSMGYNLTYLRPDSIAGVVSNDKYNAPWSAFRFRESGRTAVITLEVDGKFSGRFGRWSEYGDFLITHARWLASGEDSDGVFIDVTQKGQNARIRVEVADSRRDDLAEYPPILKIIPPDTDVEPLVPDLVWTGPQSLEANVRLDRVGTWRTLIKTGEKQFARGPVVTLPYSPEYMSRSGMRSGRDYLDDLAQRTGGKPRSDVAQIFDDPPRAVQRISLVAPLVIIALVLHLLEILGRRLDIWPRKTTVLDGEEEAGSKWQWKRSTRRRIVQEATVPDETDETDSATGVFEEARRRANARNQ